MFLPRVEGVVQVGEHLRQLRLGIDRHPQAITPLIHRPQHPDAKKRIPLLPQLFLCLSRACLGKTIVFIDNRLDKRRVLRTA